MQWILWAVVAVVIFFAFAWIGRRLLGIKRFSGAKTVLATLIGLGSGVLVAGALGWAGVEDTEQWVVGLVIGLLFTMLAIVALQVISRPGRHRKPFRLPQPRRRIERTRRSGQIASIALRHGLGGAEDPELSEAARNRAYAIRLRRALEEAGGLYVKLGQLMASRADLLPPEALEEMEKLQQDVPPAPRHAVEPVIEEEMGAPIAEIFSEFDWDPLGSASIGQVYQATLRTGDGVVVKVRRPDIEQTVHQDLEIMSDLARTVEARTDWGEQFQIAALADDFAEGVRRELDYHNEAEAATEMATAVDDPLLVIPAVYDEYTTERLLIMERVDGTPLGRTQGVGGERGRRLADAVFTLELGAMLNGDRFHADPHPGNLILQSDDRMAVIDFGATARLDAFERAGVSDVLVALQLRDPSMLREAAMSLGSVQRGSDPTAMERAFAKLMAEHLAPGVEPDSQLLQEFLEIAYQQGISLPGSVSMMIRAIGTLQRSTEMLSPGYPFIEQAQAVAQAELRAELTPENLAAEAKREAIRLAPLLRRAPRHLDRIAGQLERGELTVRVSPFGSAEDEAAVRQLVNRAILAFLGASLGVVSALMFAAQGGPAVTQTLTLYDVLGLIGMFAGAVLIMRVAMEIFLDS